ncbi:hypothetical protein [Streptomyces chrestomyceticus]|uniref:hypothetical protein n=1 Tax=Streptomyces chrestomyceticus TaxID=68185 RepID=UPI003F4CFF7E
MITTLRAFSHRSVVTRSVQGPLALTGFGVSVVTMRRCPAVTWRPVVRGFGSWAGRPHSTMIVTVTVIAAASHARSREARSPYPDSAQQTVSAQ